MARITVEDCLDHVKNRFELVLIAARRARQIMRGKEPKVPWDGDKPTVVALREIAEGYINADNINQTDRQDDILALDIFKPPEHEINPMPSQVSPPPVE